MAFFLELCHMERTAMNVLAQFHVPKKKKEALSLFECFLRPLAQTPIPGEHVTYKGQSPKKKDIITKDVTTLSPLPWAMHCG